MGFWKKVLSGNRDDSEDDLDLNQTRIENNEDEIDRLRDIRDDIPSWDNEARDEIDDKIERREDRVNYLRERREDLHEENYCDEESENEY